MQTNHKKLAILGLLTAVAILFGYVETLFPVFAGIPGIKLGLANLAVVFVLYLFPTKDAILVSAIRILVIGFMFGNLFSILFSLAGSLLSIFVMCLLMKIKDVSVIGVSIAGGVSHNLGQILVAMAVVENVHLFYYFPVLMVSGLITGAFIGILSKEVLKRLQPYVKRQLQG